MNIIYKNADCPLSLLITLLVFVVMTIFALIVVVMAGATLFAWAKPGTADNTSSSTTITPYITIAFVGNTSPVAGLDHTSVAGIITDNATGSRDFTHKIVTLLWGDGTSSQSKIARISSSSSYVEGKWGPLYHRYDSPTSASHPHAIVATMQIPQSNLSSNNGLVQIKSEPYLVNVQKGPIKTSSMDSLQSSTLFVSNNDGLSLNLMSHPVNVVALTIIGSVTGCSIYMARHRSSNQNIASTIEAHSDKK